MIVTLSIFILTAIVHIVLYFGMPVSWHLYVPISLFFTVTWLYICHLRNLAAAKLLLKNRPDLLTDSQSDMLLASPSLFMPSARKTSNTLRHDYSTAVNIILFMSTAYAVFTLIVQQWLSLMVSLIVFILPLALNLKNAFETANPQENIKRASSRCLSRIEKHPDNYNPASNPKLDYLTKDYNSIIDKLTAQKKK